MNISTNYIDLKKVDLNVAQKLILPNKLVILFPWKRGTTYHFPHTFLSDLGKNGLSSAGWIKGWDKVADDVTGEVSPLKLMPVPALRLLILFCNKKTIPAEFALEIERRGSPRDIFDGSTPDFSGV